MRLEGLRQERLQSERLASDPDSTWESHLEWIENPTAIQDIRRWRWVMGQELGDNRDKDFSDSEGACT